MSAIATPPHRTRAQPESFLVRSAVSAGAALLCCAAGLSIAQAHPLWPYELMAAFVAWSVLAALRPGYALAGLFALLPLAGFAPRTGWLTFEELDLLVLATATGAYAWRALSPGANREETATDRRFAPRLSIVSVGLVICYLATEAVSLQRGMASAGGFAFGWTENFAGPMNSLRAFKGLPWALLLAPLVLDELRRPAGFDRIGRGLTIGLALGALAVVQERYAFIGLLDFTQEYRATGSFWEMHVGGATLDAFLILTIPFAVREGLQAKHHAWLAAICGVLGLAAYAALTTFSRGLYLALAVEIALLGIVTMRRLSRRDGASFALTVVKWAVLGTAVVIGYFIVFRSGGYRGVIATLGVFALALRVAPLAARVGVATWIAALAASLVLGVCGYAIATVLPKGPYLVFAGVFAAGIAASFHAERRPSRLNSGIAMVAWLWLAFAACVVSDLWGGRAAGRDSVAVMSAFVAVVVATARWWPQLWQHDLRSQSMIAGLALLIVAPVTVFSAGSYMGDRMQSSRGDLQLRQAHWAEAIGRLHTNDDWLFGLGLGRYPASSLMAGGRSMPGTYGVLQKADGRFLRLTGPGLPYFSFGELFRFTQLVPAEPGQRYIMTVQARAETAVPLHAEICEKHLLYSLECTAKEVGVPAGLDHWTNITIPLDSGQLGRSPWYARKPLVFALAVGASRVAIDIREVHLLRSDGTDLIANGNFANGTARWFSSSDMNHGPFHTDNLVVGILLDQGLVGLGVLTLLVAGALVRTVVGRAHRHPDAAFIAIAVAGFLVVGLFDDSLEAPRIAFLFYFVLLLGLMLRNPRVTAPLPKPSPPPSSMPPEIPDAAAERARRRQQAFGTRKPAA